MFKPGDSDVSEYISEPEVQVTGVHGEGDGFKILLEDVVQSPCKVGMYSEVFVSSP